MALSLLGAAAEELLAAYEAALAIDPSLCNAHHNRGVLLDQLGADASMVVAAYEAALRKHYGSELRWAERPFWRRRATSFDGLSHR